MRVREHRTCPKLPKLMQWPYYMCDRLVLFLIRFSGATSPESLGGGPRIESYSQLIILIMLSVCSIRFSALPAPPGISEGSQVLGFFQCFLVYSIALFASRAYGRRGKPAQVSAYFAPPLLRLSRTRTNTSMATRGSVASTGP